ncbi:hypothetical protein LMG27198_01100 [Methylocystis echinoides]|uniref:Uncharacterized protein n=1 Tax=Methylocystis echinoides TaxID=29468 RepID=A0A9W6LQ26_9HYPH|nr:hypothetical protein LMG27198_01100 [Methylocystis echinoides]
MNIREGEWASPTRRSPRNGIKRPLLIIPAGTIGSSTMKPIMNPAHPKKIIDRRVLALIGLLLTNKIPSTTPNTNSGTLKGGKYM